MTASAILDIDLVAADLSAWAPEADTGLKRREARLRFRLAEVLKGRVIQKAGDIFEMTVVQRGTGGLRVMDYYGPWSHVNLSAGMSLLAFCRGASDDARVLLNQDHLQELFSAPYALSDTKAALSLEHLQTDSEVLASADAGKDRYDDLFARYVWERVRGSAIQNQRTFDEIMRIVESAETTGRARETYLSRAYEELSLRQRPPRELEIRLAQAMFRTLDLPDQDNLKNAVAELYLPNLLGLTAGKAKYSADEILPRSSNERTRRLTQLTHLTQNPATQALLEWLRR